MTTQFSLATGAHADKPLPPELGSWVGSGGVHSQQSSPAGVTPGLQTAGAAAQDDQPHAVPRGATGRSGAATLVAGPAAPGTLGAAPTDDAARTVGYGLRGGTEPGASAGVGSEATCNPGLGWDSPSRQGQLDRRDSGRPGVLVRVAAVVLAALLGVGCDGPPEYFECCTPEDSAKQAPFILECVTAARSGVTSAGEDQDADDLVRQCAIQAQRLFCPVIVEARCPAEKRRR